ncbi:hypothetical protein DPMN_036043, partial [Dreissena polymorpha]
VQIKKRKTGDEASDLRVAKKKNDNTSGGKGFGKRKRRFIYDTTLCRSRLVMITDEERKKHLWIKFLMDLYTSFMQYMHILLLILYIDHDSQMTPIDFEVTRYIDHDSQMTPIDFQVTRSREFVPPA